ncbi:MAG: hypothetical protein E2O38_03795 [Proteobacteria bacterium]|nr:MAG: hypothetical protein E2O38_03795 [Pseudomonadota bacterium]
MHPISLRPAIRLIIFGLVLALIHPVAHAGAPFERFFGSYRGESTSIPEGEVSKRTMSVAIKPAKKGFVVEWEAEISKTDGRSKQKGLSITFIPTNRKNIYKSAMRRDLFGHAGPMNLLKGDPFIWARIAGDTLTVYVIRVTESGGQDLRIYKRWLTPQGMESEFVRFYDSEPIRRIGGVLKKVGTAQLVVPTEQTSISGPDP